jgi:hypothetical protein
LLTFFSHWARKEQETDDKTKLHVLTEAEIPGCMEFLQKINARRAERRREIILPPSRKEFQSRGAAISFPRGWIFDVACNPSTMRRVQADGAEIESTRNFMQLILFINAVGAARQIRTREPRFSLRAAKIFHRVACHYERNFHVLRSLEYARAHPAKIRRRTHARTTLWMGAREQTKSGAHLSL